MNTFLRFVRTERHEHLVHDYGHFEQDAHKVATMTRPNSLVVKWVPDFT
jgi:hypothetical protein